MSKKTVVLFITLFALIVAGMFIFAHLQQSDMQGGQTADPVNKQY